ncbi:MAG: TetR/AcrR family transcriptional regulator [Stappiaceae bacterium]
MAKPKGSNKENLERTRAHLLAVARGQFAQKGFHATSTTAVIEEAGSSRGALYHHFRDKTDLFQSVYDSLGGEVADRLETYPYSGQDPVEDLIAGCLLYLEIFVEADFAQILLIDGPTVLGLDYCRSRDAVTAYKALEEGLAMVNHADFEASLMADFLAGAMDSLALRIALASNRQTAYRNRVGGFEKLVRKVLV